MKILLIAGHGAQDSGAVAKIDGVTYKEADLTREVVSNLKPILEGYGVSVGVYPTSHDAYTDYKNGKLVANANFSAYDYVLEIHFNAGGTDLKGDGRIKGDEIFWASRGQATGLETAITSRLFTGVAQRQSKSGQFAVINTAAGYGKKANLLEVCFIDDADDMRYYIKNKKQIAQNIADGIAEKYNLKNSIKIKATVKEEDEDMVRYKTINDIPAGAYRDAVKEFVDLGIIKGYADGTLDLSEDIIRGMIFGKRYADKKIEAIADAVAKQIVDKITNALKG